MAVLVTRDIKVSTSARIEQKISNRVGYLMYNKLLHAQTDIERRVEEHLVKAIKNSRVYKGLDGTLSQGGGDLQAEFGLGPDQKVEEALSDLINILKSTIRVRMKYSVASRTNAVISISMLNSDEYESRLINGENFSYPSITKRRKLAGRKPGGGLLFETYERSVEIRWMEWLITNSLSTNMKPDIKGYGIKKNNLTAKQEAISRTGRAIMIKRAGSKTKWQPYALPRIVRPTVKGSKNFIEDIALSVHFRKTVADIAERAARKAFKLKV